MCCVSRRYADVLGQLGQDAPRGLATHAHDRGQFRDLRVLLGPGFLQGDELRLQCHFDNSAGNQPVVDGVPEEPRDIHWGEGTTDEMCLGMLQITRP